MSNMGKGAGYYLTRSKSLLIDTAIVAILAIFMSFAMQMDALQSKGEDYLVLMLYAVIFGLTSLQSGAMIVDLTAKDKLSRRVEFFAASGIAVKEIIKQYSIQIFRFSGIIPFFVFMSCYYFTDWTMSFGRIVCVYLSILVLSFCEIVALNIIVLDVKRVKLFKNVLFFGNFALVYLIAMSAERITEFVNCLQKFFLFGRFQVRQLYRRIKGDFLLIHHVQNFWNQVGKADKTLNLRFTFVRIIS